MGEDRGKLLVEVKIMIPLKNDDMNLDQSRVPMVLRPLCKIGVGVLSVAYPAMAIPFAILGCVYGEIKEQSTQKMLKRLEKQYQELESKSLVSQEYLASEHYVHLMVDILRKVYAFNTDQKRESVAKIYKDTVQNKVEYADSDEKLFIEAIEKINTQEIHILTFMLNNETVLQTIDSWKNFYKLFSDYRDKHPLDKYKFKFFTSQLENMGLVYCSDLEGYDDNGMTMMWDTSRESSAGVTQLGKEFLKYLGDMA